MIRVESTPPDFSLLSDASLEELRVPYLSEEAFRRTTFRQIKARFRGIKRTLQKLHPESKELIDRATSTFWGSIAEPPFSHPIALEAATVTIEDAHALSFAASNGDPNYCASIYRRTRMLEAMSRYQNEPEVQYLARRWNNTKVLAATASGFSEARSEVYYPSPEDPREVEAFVSNGVNLMVYPRFQDQAVCLRVESPDDFREGYRLSQVEDLRGNDRFRDMVVILERMGMKDLRIATLHLSVRSVIIGEFDINAANPVVALRNSPRLQRNVTGNIMRGLTAN